MELWNEFIEDPPPGGPGIRTIHHGVIIIALRVAYNYNDYMYMYGISLC
jgi:hypothetical protein